MISFIEEYSNKANPINEKYERKDNVIIAY